jgi:hypothetical protein
MTATDFLAVMFLMSFDIALFQLGFRVRFDMPLAAFAGMIGGTTIVLYTAIAAYGM